MDEFVDKEVVQTLKGSHQHLSTISIENKLPSVVSYSEIVENKKITGFKSVNSLLFVKVTCDSIVEAKRRVAVLALVSYNVRNHTFIRGFSKESLKDPFFVSSINKLLNY